MKEAMARGFMWGRAARALLAFVVLAFCAAPVPGDVGGCNQSAEDLDPQVFFRTKARIDCDQCSACGFDTEACVPEADAVGLPQRLLAPRARRRGVFASAPRRKLRRVRRLRS